MRTRVRVCVGGWLCLLLFAHGELLYAQLGGLGGGPKPKPKPPVKKTEPAKTDPNAPPPSLAIKIPNEPHGIDPATLLPKKLAARATVRFEDKLLREIVEWLQKEQKLDIQLDLKALEEAAYDLYEPLFQELNDEPVYLLLNRLRNKGLAWYLEDGIVHLTTRAANESQHYTVSYLLSELFDTGYASGDDLINVLQSTIEPTTWKANGGQGSAIVLGDVLFIRQTSDVHLQVAGLLAALKTHGRQTFVIDPPEHQKLRELLEQPVTVKIQNVPFQKAIPELSKILKIKILVDQKALDDAAFDDRTLMTIEAQQQKLRHVLRGLTANYALTTVLRDGALWITTKTAAENAQITAVYDVRDLCQDESEGDALISTIGEQASPTAWKMNGGQGDVIMAKNGVMVVNQTEEIQDEVLRLLENYRTALRSSKPRPAPVSEPYKVYYRVSQAMAQELRLYIPTEIQPKTWRTADAKAPGTITVMTSTPKLIPADGAGKNESMPQAVMIIQQTDDVHNEIADLIANLEHGTLPPSKDPALIKEGGGPGAFGGMGGGGGQGFGQGFFSVPTK